MTTRGADHPLGYVAQACFAWLLILSSAGAQSPIQFRDVTRETGITFCHTDGGSGEHYIVEWVSAGMGLFDYDGDGNIDVYFLNGAPLRGTKVGRPPTNALYRNEGEWKFTDVTEQAGVGDRGFGLGVAVGDYDGDGDPDLYVNNHGPNVLYRNNGDGTFADVTEQAGVSGGDKTGAGAAFLDADRDGDLDLYVGNYVQFTYENHVRREIRGVPMYPGPRDYEPWPDTLYRNNGDGTFTDVSDASGVGAVAGTSMGMVCLDYDKDGDTDVFVCNDAKGNFLFQNDGTGKFEEVGLMTGTAFNLYGQENGSMGADCGDYDNDGWPDIYLTDYQGDMPVLYRNLGNGFFEDVTLRTGAGAGAFPHINWGTSLVDFDNDGDRDLFLACGHLQDNIELTDDTAHYEARNLLLMNTGRGKFLDVSDQSGDGMLVKRSSRGAAFDDLDNDGDVDVVVLNSRREPTVLRNDTQRGNHWLQVRLQGTKANRHGVGARLKVTAGDLAQIAEVHAGRGYQSHYGTRLYFGLGSRDHVDRIEVSWIGGPKETYQDFDVDQLVTLTEGTGRASGAGP
jgi:hypothetical protein